MSIGLYALFGKILIKTQINSFFKNLLINRNAVIPHNDTLRVSGLGGLGPPSMLANVINPISFSRIHCKYFWKNVLRILRKCFWDLVLPRQYLLVKFGSFRVFKGQATTEHSIQDNPTAPYIHHNGLISIFAFDHFRRSVARRPTSSF